MRVGAMILLATLAVMSLIAYLLLGYGPLLTNPASPWGAIRVGCLLIDFVSVIVLSVLLLLYWNELKNIPTARVIVIAVCVVNGLFLAFIIVLLFLVLLPLG